jgi:hypothetical protein
MQWFMDELRAAEEEQLRVLPFLLGKKRADQLRWSAIREFFECSRARDSDGTSLSRGSSAESDPDGSRRSAVALPIDPKASFKLRTRKSMHSPDSDSRDAGNEDEGDEDAGDEDEKDTGALRVSRQFIAPNKERRQTLAVYMSRFAKALYEEVVGRHGDRGEPSTAHS